MRERDQLDLLIDSAAASYGEPPAELEDRVLQALTVARATNSLMPETPRIQRRWMPWLIALPVAACLLLVLFIQLRGSNHHTQAEVPSSAKMPTGSSKAQVMAHTGPPSTIVDTGRTRRRAVASATVPETERAALPKLDVFPTPRPLTPEERALSVYSGRAPKPELEALARAQTQDEKPFPIAASHIPPLPPSDEDKN